MDILIFILLFAGVFGLCIFGYGLDRRFNMQTMKWLNMEASSPFKDEAQTQPPTDYQDLKDRVATLEKIVTDPRWELDQKIKNL